MSYCKEKPFDLVVGVDAIPLGYATFSTPVYSDVDYISSSELQPMLSSAVSIPLDLVPANPVKATSSVNGLVSTVQFDVPIVCNDLATHELIASLCRTPHCLVVYHFGGSVSVIRTSEEGYLCTKKEDGPSLSLSFTMTNGHGITRVL